MPRACHSGSELCHSGVLKFHYYRNGGPKNNPVSRHVSSYHINCRGKNGRRVSLSFPLKTFSIHYIQERRRRQKNQIPWNLQLISICCKERGKEIAQKFNEFPVEKYSETCFKHFNLSKHLLQSAIYLLAGTTTALMHAAAVEILSEAYTFFLSSRN